MNLVIAHNLQFVLVLGNGCYSKNQYFLYNLLHSWSVTEEQWQKSYVWGRQREYKKIISDSNKIFNNNIDEKFQKQVHNRPQSSQLKYYAYVKDFSPYSLGARVNKQQDNVKRENVIYIRGINFAMKSYL